MRYNNNTSATTCATMHREEKNGTTTATLNGTAETATAKDEYITHPRPERTNYNQGGRLKFFKDGKFILELERAREGERVSWVSVPRKTFWPPQSTPTSTPTYRQESSTSLSVSDDNSSIQSSPWQRDHSWKQTTPQRNLSKALCFYYRRSRQANVSPPALTSNTHRKCHYRRPYRDITVKPDTDNMAAGEVVVARRHRGKYRCMGLLAIAQCLVERIGANASVCAAVVNGIVSLGAIRTPPRQDVIVSPRKRFLREMDRDSKVTLDDNCQKRSRSKQPSTPTTNNHVPPIACASSSSSSSSTNSIPTPTSVITTNSNGTPSDTSPTTTSASAITTSTTNTTTRSSSSYSITSLLADDRPNSGSGGGKGGRKASPVASVASVITNTTASHPAYLGFGGAGHAMASVDDRLYTENVDRLRSIELSHADKRLSLSYSPLHTAPSLPAPGPSMPTLHPSYAAYLPYHHHPALYHPHHYPPASAPSSPLYYAALYASQQHQSSSRPSPYHPSPYLLPTLHPPAPPPPPAAGRSHALLTGLHHHSNSVWTAPGSQRQSVASALPHAQVHAHAQPADLMARMHQQVAALPPVAMVAAGAAVLHNDTLPDMPLNLSKNAG